MDLHTALAYVLHDILADLLNGVRDRLPPFQTDTQNTCACGCINLNFQHDTTHTSTCLESRQCQLADHSEHLDYFGVNEVPNDVEGVTTVASAESEDPIQRLDHFQGSEHNSTTLSDITTDTASSNKGKFWKKQLRQRYTFNDEDEIPQTRTLSEKNDPAPVGAYEEDTSINDAEETSGKDNVRDKAIQVNINNTEHSSSAPIEKQTKGSEQKFVFKRPRRSMYLADESGDYKCPFCDKMFTNYAAVSRHVNSTTHAGRKIKPKRPKFQCPICKKILSRGDTLKAHVQKH